MIYRYLHRIACTILAICIAGTCFSQLTVSLYPGSIPNSKTHQQKETKTFEPVVDTILRLVSEPTLTVFKAAENPGRAAVIIVPGGGYHAQLITREGHRIAEQFNERGITAFVLKYRLPGDEIMVDKTTGPLQDLQQAIKLVRDNAAQWELDPRKIGVMGFSAGGHLAASGGVHYKDAHITNNSGTSLRPDFMILINPVISFTDRFGHIGSRNNLLGQKPSAEKIRYFSNELHITGDTPPAVLVHAGDDTVVPIENSLVFYRRLQEHGIPASLHMYAKGEHGLLHEPAFQEWFGRCIFWMEQIGITDKQIR